MFRVVKDDKPARISHFETVALFPEGLTAYPRVIPPGSRSVPIPVGTEGRIIGYRQLAEDILHPRPCGFTTSPFLTPKVLGCRWE